MATSLSSAWSRGLVAGFCGTAAMAATTLAESRLRPGDQPVDYDDSLVLLEIVERVAPLDPSPTTARALNQLLRFGYGTTAGLLRAAFGDRVPVPAMALFGVIWVGEGAALWTLRAAPPPWRWKTDVLLSSVVQHGIYAIATDLVYRALTPRRTDTPQPDEQHQ